MCVSGCSDERAANDRSGQRPDGASNGSSDGKAPEDARVDRSDASETARTDTGVPEGGREIWNGRDLSEWDGDPRIWRVEGGAIVAYAPTYTIGTNTFLIYRGGKFRDFVLSGEIWVQSPYNSGFQYRSTVVDPARWAVFGYQADAGENYWGMLFDEGGGRGILATTSAACLQSAGYDRWNAYEITASGTRLVHEVNGFVCVDFQDVAEDRAIDGVIALQYHSPAGFEVRFRNLRLQEL